MGLLFSLIVELAEYERAADQVVGTPQLLHDALFGESAVVEALVAELDGKPVGFALFYTTFSTWQCRAGLWLEDLYVAAQHRRSGAGGALMRRLAAIALERGCVRLEWAALDWNTPALEFYASIDARRLDEWVMHRLAGEPLRRAAESAPPSSPSPPA